MPLSAIWDSVRDHFFRPDSLERTALMRRVDWRREPWFQVELMWLLDQLAARGLVTSWKPEQPVGNGKRVDFKIEVASTSAALELKTALCGHGRDGKLWKPQAYGKVECYDAVCKLMPFPPPRYLLVFAWPGCLENDPALTSHDWDEMLQAVRSTASMAGITFVRKPESSPDGGLSIGIFQIP